MPPRLPPPLAPRYPPAMAAILPILIFVIAVVAANWVEFGRPD